MLFFIFQNYQFFLMQSMYFGLHFGLFLGHMGGGGWLTFLAILLKMVGPMNSGAHLGSPPSFGNRFEPFIGLFALLYTGPYFYMATDLPQFSS